MSQHFLLFIKGLFFLNRTAGGETILVKPTFGGCAQYTPLLGYVADPACDSFPGVIQII